MCACPGLLTDYTSSQGGLFNTGGESRGYPVNTAELSLLKWTTSIVAATPSPVHRPRRAMLPQDARSLSQVRAWIKCSRGRPP
jgi:hypothetical protein